MNYTPVIPAFTIKPTLRNLNHVEPISTKQLDKTADFNFVSFSKRVIITLVNLLANTLVIFCSLYILQYSLEYNTSWPQFIYFFVWLGLYTYLLFAFGVSPGAFMVRAKVVNTSGNYLDITSAFFRNLPYFLSLILHTALVWNVAEQNITLSSQTIWGTWEEIFAIYNTKSPFLFQILLSFQLFILFDMFSTLFNAQRRALRDFLSDSYVIERTNYYRIAINKKHHGDGIYEKTEEELRLEQEREFNFKVLNHVMEIPEVMKEVQRVNEYKVSKIIAKIETKPIIGKFDYYEISIKENDMPLFCFRINPKNMRVLAKDQEKYIALAEWRKKYYDVNWIKTYFFLH